MDNEHHEIQHIMKISISWDRHIASCESAYDVIQIRNGRQPSINRQAVVEGCFLW